MTTEPAVSLLDSGAMGRCFGDECVGAFAGAVFVCYGSVLRPCPSAAIAVALAAVALDEMAADQPVEYAVEIDDPVVRDEVARLLKARGVVSHMPAG